MKLALISDTHEQHNQVTIPPCDVLVHAGDLTYRGDYESVFTAIRWIKNQPATHKIIIAGNHDFLFEKNPESGQSLIEGTGIHYLEDSEVVINGIKFWGSPYTPRFFDWAFNADRGEVIRKHWNLIPDNTDVLITHGPPQTILDQAAPHKNSQPLGCLDLRLAVDVIRPKVHVFGHIHGGYGQVSTEGTQFFNASVVNEAYKVVNKPFVVEI